MYHLDRSAVETRKYFKSNDFELGSLAVGPVVLTHFSRLTRQKELDMNCVGDGIDNSEPKACLDHTTCFFFKEWQGKAWLTLA
ncbi:MAG: hypothetical protein M2R46_01130 [Verrucomicrobia subdivision 3 bacterium]|nr:hypothetical protein [Limisphaerales bacterium]